MHAQELALDPREIVRRFRETHTHYPARWPASDLIPDGVTVRTPRDEPIDDASLPASLRAELRAYSRAHPHRTITFLKHLRTVDGRPERIIDDGADLPGEAQLLVLSQTVTLADWDSVRVVTDLFVARKDDADPGRP